MQTACDAYIRFFPTLKLECGDEVNKDHFSLSRIQGNITWINIAMDNFLLFYTAKCPNSTWLERGKCRTVRARVGANLPRASGGSRGIAFPAPILLELTFDHFSTSLFLLPNLFPATQASKQLDFRTVGSNSSNSSPNSSLVISSLSPLPSHLFVARFSVEDPLSKSSTSI